MFNGCICETLVTDNNELRVYVYIYIYVLGVCTTGVHVFTFFPVNSTRSFLFNYCTEYAIFCSINSSIVLLHIHVL